jgi:hypothetical protein
LHLPSAEIALVAADCDAVHGVLSITKAHVLEIDKDMIKTGQARSIILCPRSIAVIESQPRLRKRLVQSGLIDDEHLFACSVKKWANATLLPRL